MLEVFHNNLFRTTQRCGGQFFQEVGCEKSRETGQDLSGYQRLLKCLQEMRCHCPHPTWLPGQARTLAAISGLSFQTEAPAFSPWSLFLEALLDCSWLETGPFLWAPAPRTPPSQLFHPVFVGLSSWRLREEAVTPVPGPRPAPRGSHHQMKERGNDNIQN